MRHDATADVELDATGLSCPLPVLRAQKRLRQMQAGEVLLLISTDKVSESEVPLFCEQAGHALLTHQHDNGQWRFWIRRG